MTAHPHQTSEQVKPHSRLYDDGGAIVSWLADEWTREEICDPDGEFGYMEIEPAKLTEIWMGCRWTTDAERADEDVLWDLFGDYENIDTSVVYWRASADTPGAVRYWTVDP